jgi:hypothetical protein
MTSGHIRLQDDTIVYTIPGGDGWQSPVSGVRVIGEFTDDHGPVVDDYFFVFLARDEYFAASFYAEGRDPFLAELGQRLNHTLRSGLCHSTSLASRVLWPARLEGHAMFELVPEEPAGTILGRLRQRVLPRGQVHFTDEVQRELTSSRCHRTNRMQRTPRLRLSHMPDVNGVGSLIRLVIPQDSRLPSTREELREERYIR